MKNIFILSLLGTVVYCVSANAAGGPRGWSETADRIEAEGKQELAASRALNERYNRAKDSRNRMERDSSQDFKKTQDSVVELQKKTVEARGAKGLKDAVSKGNDAGEQLKDTINKVEQSLDPSVARGEVGANLADVAAGESLKTEADKLEKSGQQKIANANELRKGGEDLEKTRQALEQKIAASKAIEDFNARKAAADKAAKNEPRDIGRFQSATKEKHSPSERVEPSTSGSERRQGGGAQNSGGESRSSRGERSLPAVDNHVRGQMFLKP